MSTEAAARDLLSAITARDVVATTKVLARDVRVRALLPGGYEEYEGSPAVAGRLEAWFGGAEPFEVLAGDVRLIEDKVAVAFRLRLTRPGAQAETIIEQTWLCSGRNGTIEHADVLCSGFRPLAQSAGATHDYDAGSLGCADGLAGAFKERLMEVDVGDLLRVTTVDPSAKEDLPSLARLMGHTVRSIEARADGALTITVERGR
jgi:TusA-related sulfurtransferase